MGTKSNKNRIMLMNEKRFNDLQKNISIHE